MADASSSQLHSEPESKSKNAPRLNLLDDEGELTENVRHFHSPALKISSALIRVFVSQAVSSLEHIFAKYCTPEPANKPDAASAETILLQPPEGAVFTDDAVDAWALDTNGALLSDGEKAELEMLDVDDDGRLTYVLGPTRLPTGM